MFSDCDEGLTDEIFTADLDQYIYDNHSEDEADRLYTLPRYEQVCKVLEELELQNKLKP